MFWNEIAHQTPLNYTFQQGELHDIWIMSQKSYILSTAATKLKKINNKKKHVLGNSNVGMLDSCV